MAQLTWRNVDAPNFSGVVDATRLMADSINRGLGAGRAAISDFQADQTQSQSAQLMAAAMGAKNPADLAGIIGKFNPGYLSADALKFTADRPQDLATLDTTNIRNEYDTAANPLKLQGLTLDNSGKAISNNTISIANDYAQKANPLRLQSLGLVNADQAIKNAVSGFGLTKDMRDDGQAQEVRAAQSAYEAMLTEARALQQTGIPANILKAQEILGGAEFSRLASAARKDAPAAIAASTPALQTGVATRGLIADTVEKDRRTVLEKQADAAFENLANTQSSKDSALRAVDNDNTLTTEFKAAVRDRIEKKAEGSWKPLTEMDLLYNAARPAAAAPVQTGAIAAPAPGVQAAQAIAAAAGQPAAAVPAAVAPPVAIQAPASPTSALNVQAMLDQSTDVNRGLQSVQDEAVADEGFNPMAPIMNELVTRPNAKKSMAEVTDQLWKDLGSDTNDGNFIAARGLTVPILTGEVNRVVNKYGIAPDMAASVIKSAIGPNLETFGDDTRSVDQNMVDKQVEKLIDTTGENKGKVKASVLQDGTARLALSRQKNVVVERAKQIQATVEAAKSEYVTAQARAQTNPRVDLEGPRARYEAALAFARRETAKLDKDPSVRANTRPLTK